MYLQKWFCSKFSHAFKPICLGEVSSKSLACDNILLCKGWLVLPSLKYPDKEKRIWQLSEQHFIRSAFAKINQRQAENVRERQEHEIELCPRACAFVELVYSPQAIQNVKLIYSNLKRHCGLLLLFVNTASHQSIIWGEKESGNGRKKTDRKKAFQIKSFYFSISLSGKTTLTTS